MGLGVVVRVGVQNESDSGSEIGSGRDGGTS